MMIFTTNNEEPFDPEFVTIHNYEPKYKMMDSILETLNGDPTKACMLDEKFIKIEDRPLKLECLRQLKKDKYIERVDEGGIITEHGINFWTKDGGYKSKITSPNEAIVYKYLSENLGWIHDTDIEKHTGLDEISIRKIIDKIDPDLYQRTAPNPKRYGQTYCIELSDAARKLLKTALTSKDYTEIKIPEYTAPTIAHTHIGDVFSIHGDNNNQSNNLLQTTGNNAPIAIPEKNKIPWNNIWAVISIVVAIVLAVIGWYFFAN